MFEFGFHHFPEAVVEEEVVVAVDQPSSKILFSVGDVFDALGFLMLDIAVFFVLLFAPSICCYIHPEKQVMKK